MPSQKHELMKRTARAVLEHEGFDVQYEKEYTHGLADVYGERDGETVIVEVGDLGNERADYFSGNCDTLIHVPYSRPTDGNGRNVSETGNKRTNIIVNEWDWEELDENLGNMSRSEFIRSVTTVFNSL